MVLCDWCAREMESDKESIYCSDLCSEEAREVLIRKREENPNVIDIGADGWEGYYGGWR